MLTTYIIGSLALIVKPGPDLMCTIATALSEGKARAATLMAGLVLGCWLWIVLLAVGVAAFFASHGFVLTVVQAVGVAYIAYLAVCSFKDAWQTFRSDAAGAFCGAEGSGWRLVWRGVMMSMSNPLTILFFLAFLPGFTHVDAALSPTVQTLLLGLLFCALVPFVYFPIIMAADFFRARLIGSKKSLACLKLVSALLLSAVSVVLLVGMRTAIAPR